MFYSKIGPKVRDGHCPSAPQLGVFGTTCTYVAM